MKKETGRLLVIAAVALAGGCALFFPTIRSDITASVGVIGESNIHEIAGDYFARRESFWTEYGSRQGQMLHVHFSASRDLVSFVYKKDFTMSVRWHFCDDARKEVRLGETRAFVNGAEVWNPLSMPSPARDGTDRFVFDAILYVRDTRPAEQRWLYGREDTGVLEEAFDLELKPRDVCVAVWLIKEPFGHRTKVTRIPKQDIAAALSVEVPSASPAELGAATP